MDPLELQAAKAAIKHSLEWKASKIMIDLQSKLGEAVTVDLASMIKKVPTNGKGIASDRQLLMHRCNLIPYKLFEGSSTPEENKKRVTGYLQNACRRAGFMVVAGRTRFTNKKTIKVHTYNCPRHRHKTESLVPDSNRKKNRGSHRPTLDEPRCPFKFCICEDTASGAFFFPANLVSGDIHHVGHPILPAIHVPVTMKSIPSDVKKDVSARS